ncbi:MAG: hypothetical protein L3J16_04015 [Anaerolineales bacterium]|nr:hypothetical protein [Anaerolineales bacterium]
MEFNFITVIVLAVVLIAGYLFGLMDLKAKKEEYGKDEAASAEEEKIPAAVVSEPEALTLFELGQGRLKLRLDGVMLANRAELTIKQRDRLLKLVVALRPWLEIPQAEKPPAPLPAETKSITVPVAEKADNKETAYIELSMVEQIDLVLQKKLDGHPLEQRGVQLRSAPDGSLLVLVGLDKYAWIDDIPDQAIQAIIRESIAEWEEMATPK